jgi:endonuclease/exonuclease/phosphatase family metal-dependent hydrolase
MRVLSWNLYHGRPHPPRAGLRFRPLLDEFAAVLDELDWEVALLQEAPPRWFRELARRTRSSGVRVLTSRNVCPAIQGALADWNGDLIGSWEGGSNQILVRAPGRVLEHHNVPLAFRPERRRMHWVRVDLPAAGRVCVANLHASAGLPAKATKEVELAAAVALKWSGRDPLVLGGDFNLRPRDQPEPFARLRELGFGDPTAPDAIDHLLARGLRTAEAARRLAPRVRDGLTLSDHGPVTAAFVR